MDLKICIDKHHWRRLSLFNEDFLKNSFQERKGICNLEQYSVVDKDKATLSYFVTEVRICKSTQFLSRNTNKQIYLLLWSKSIEYEIEILTLSLRSFMVVVVYGNKTQTVDILPCSARVSSIPLLSYSWKIHIL